MTSTNSFPGLGPRAAALIRHHASRLAASDCRLEREDMEQELASHLHLRVDRFEHGRADRATFDDRVVRHRAADLARDARAAKRGPVAALSLEELGGEGDGIDNDGKAGDAAWRARMLEQAIEWEESAALRYDLARFLAMQPHRLRECCLLLVTHSVAETARVLGRHRSTIYAWLAMLRERGRAAGLGIYLAASPTDSSPAE